MKGKDFRRRLFLRLLLAGIAAAGLASPVASAAAPPRYVWAKAWHILPETHSDESGYFSLCEGLDGTVYVGTARYNRNAYLVAFDPVRETQRIAVDVNETCGLRATGFAAQAKIHTRNSVGPSGTIYCGSKQGYRSPGDASEYPGGHVIAYDPRIDRAEDLGLPFPGQGAIDVAADERRGLLYVVTCEDQHWMLGDRGKRSYRELGPILTPYASTLIGPDGRASALTKDFELAQYDPADGKVTVRPIAVGGRRFLRGGSLAIPTWVLGAGGRSAWLVLLDDPTLLEIDLAGSDPEVRAVDHGRMIEGKHPDCRSALALGPEGRVYAVVRVDNETGFGSGYLHHLLRYDPAKGAREDLGVLAVQNPDYFDFAGKGGVKPPWSHGFHVLPDGTLTPLHHHMALLVAADGAIYVTVIYPFTLLRVDRFRREPAPSTPASLWLDAALERCDRVESAVGEFTREAEIVAERHIAGGMIGFQANGHTLQEELFGRSGGLMHMGFQRPFRAERRSEEKARDVAIVGWDRAPRAGDREALEGLRARGCRVIGFGPRGLPEVQALAPLCDAFFDTGTGADDRVVPIAGGRRAGRANPIANALAGWVFTGELIAAFTRRGKMPPLWKAYAYEDGPAWGERFLGKVQFHEEYRVEPIPPGRLGREYLERIRYLLRRFHRTQIDEVRRAAGLIVDEVGAGRKVCVASTGHMAAGFVGLYEDAEWAMNVGAHDGYMPGLKAFEEAAPVGGLVLRLGYAGLYRDVAAILDRKKERVILITAENPRSEFAARPAGLVASIDTGYAFGDACVAIPGYPLRALPPSGVMQCAAYGAIDAEVQARLAER